MKFRYFLPAAFAPLLTGCGTVAHALNTVTGTAANLVRTVTAPVSGILHAADEGSEKAWQEKADSQNQQKQAHDRRRVKTKRPR